MRAIKSRNICKHEWLLGVTVRLCIVGVYVVDASKD